MSRYRERFPKPALFVVIHVTHERQAVNDGLKALQAGADGIFLIEHGRRGFAWLMDIYEAVRREAPHGWIGINFLDLSPDDAVDLVPPGANGLWTDALPRSASRIERSIADRRLRVLFFGGVAFKYQPPVGDVSAAVRNAPLCIDVLTTSGPGTGSPPDLGKLSMMRASAGTRPLAIASGISATNVRSFLPYTDAFLVASSLEANGSLDETRVRDLARLVHTPF